jgi:hypothetical protein
MPAIGPMELIILLTIALLIFGPQEAAGARPVDRHRDPRVQAGGDAATTGAAS